MKVLVACEYSGIVRDAFTRAGHDALSCDLLPSETPGRHYQGDVRDVLEDDYDLLIGHPPCTFLANSGVRWLHEKSGRWRQMVEGCGFFNMLLYASHIPRIAIENPVIHGHALHLIGMPATQTVQPWQFGHGETKRVCLWLKNLPPLAPTEIVSGREARVHRMAPGPDRQKERSRFFAGIANAMANQWGSL